MRLEDFLTRYNGVFSQKSPLTLEDVKYVLNNRGVDYTLLACFFALKKMTPQAKAYILKQTELFPITEILWINSCFNQKTSGLLKAMEFYVKHPSIEQQAPDKDYHLGNLVHYLLLYTQCNEKTVSDILAYSYEKVEYKKEVGKRLLTILGLSFINYLPILINCTSFKEFLNLFIQPFLEGKEQTTGGALSDETLYLSFRDSKTNYLETLKINAKCLPKYFLYQIPLEQKIPDFFQSFKRLPKKTYEFYKKELVYSPLLTSKEVLELLKTTDKPNWSDFTFRGVILEEKYFMTNDLWSLIKEVYTKHGLDFIKFLLRSTTGDTLYDRWVLKEALQIKDSSDDFLDSLYSFSGIAMANERYLSKENSRYFLKNVKKNFTEEQYNTAVEEMIEVHPHATPDAILVKTLEDYREKLKKQKLKTNEYLTSSYRDEDRIFSSQRKEKKLEKILSELRSLAIKSDNSQAKIKGIFGVSS